jgi:hypothetical protein
MTNNIGEFAKHIFDSQPKEPCTVHVAFEDDGKTIKDLFELLFIILKYGIQLVYGVETIDMDDIRDEHIILLNQYFNSFGYKIFYKKIEEPSLPNILTNQYLEDIDNFDDSVLPNLHETYIHETTHNTNNIHHNEILTKKYETLKAEKTDKLTDYFINLSSNNNKYKLYFDSYIS